MSDWSALRAEFPATSACTYLNTAAGGPMSRAAAAAGAGYYEATCRDGDVHWDAWLDRVETVRADTAAFVGARPDEIGFVANASAGMSLVAGVLRGAGEVLAVRDDFPSITLPWLQLGYPVRFLEPGPEGGATLENIEAALTPATRVLAIGLVHYRSGFRYELSALGRLARARGLMLVVDATQGLGALRVDLADDNVDFMVSSGYKWLTAGYGVGVLYVNRRHLRPEQFPAAGWRSAEDPYALVADRLALRPAAGALELGHPPFPGVFALGAALELLHDLGHERIEQRVLRLNDYLVDRLRASGREVTVADSTVNRSGIVYLPLPDAGARKKQLDRQGVLVSQRGNGLRISAHFYNRRADLDHLIEALAGRGGSMVGLASGLLG